MRAIGTMQADSRNPNPQYRDGSTKMVKSSNIRKSALGLLRRFPAFRQVVRKSYYGLRSLHYKKLAASIDVDRKTVLFECFGGRQASCSPRAIYEQMLIDPKFNDFTFVWAFEEDRIGEYERSPEFDRAELVVRSSDDYLKACAQAKYWIINNRIAEYIAPKPEQVYVQCWHGTPLKRLGFDVKVETTNALNTATELAERFGLDSKKWTYLLSPSIYTSQRLSEAFGLEEHRRSSVILEEGYPRNDRISRICSNPSLLQETISAFRQKHGIAPRKKLLLYAPTWRDDSFQSGKGYVMEDSLLDFDVLRNSLEDEWAILFRAHYYIANEFDFSAYEGFVYDVSKVADINDLYIIADALLTDYSSVFFDYANTKRPLLFFWPDWEHYANDIRGFYFDPKELPGPQCYTTEEVATAVSNLDSYESRYGREYTEFRKKFCPKDDGHASERVIKAVFN